MSNALLKIIIRAQDLATQTFKTVGSNMSSLKDQAVGLSQHGFLIAKKGFEALKGALLVGVPLITGALSAIGAIGLKAADEFEKGRLKYETLLGSQQAAFTRIKELQEFAAKTPFELNDIIKADVLLQGFGIRSQQLLTIIGNAAAISGSGFAELSLIMGQLSQSKDLENIKQLVERGVVSFEELRQAGIAFAKDGSVINSVEQTYGAVVSIMEKKFKGGMEKLSGTMSGMMTTIMDNLNIGLGTIVTESGLLDFVKEKMTKLIALLDSIDWAAVGIELRNYLNSITPILENIGAVAMRVFTALQQGWSWFWTTGWPILQPILLGLYNLFMTWVYPSLVKLTNSFLELWNVISPYILPVLQFLAVIVGVVLIGAIIVLCATLKVLAETFAFVFGVIKQRIEEGKQLVESFWKQWDLAGQTLKNIFNSIAINLGMTIGAKIKAIIDMVNFLINQVNSVSSAVGVPKLPNITVPGFASGVRNFSGGLAIVGEKGPELVSLPKGSNVYSNQETQRMLENSSPVNVTLNFSGSFLGTARDRRELVQSLKSELQQILYNNNHVLLN